MSGFNVSGTGNLHRSHIAPNVNSAGANPGSNPSVQGGSSIIVGTGTSKKIGGDTSTVSSGIDKLRQVVETGGNGGSSNTGDNIGSNPLVGSNGQRFWGLRR